MKIIAFLLGLLLGYALASVASIVPLPVPEWVISLAFGAILAYVV